MTFEKIDEVMTLDAEFLESWRADAARIANEDWRELAALLEWAKEFEKDLPAFDVPDGFLLDETSFSGFESAW
jgi:hypothetical protein